MGLREIVFNNLRKRKGKMFLLVTGITIGITTVVTLFSLTMAMNDKMLKDFKEAGTKVIITPQSENTSFSFGGITVAANITFDVKEMPSNVVNILKNKVQDLNIKYIAPKKIIGVKINQQPSLLVGVDFKNELYTKPWLKIAGKLPESDSEIILGSSSAKFLKKKLGDTLKVNDREFRVVGILHETGGQEDEIIMASLKLVENLSGSTNLSLVELIIENESDVENIKALLPGVKVTPVKEAMKSRKEVIQRYEYFAILVSFVILIIAVLIVLTTMMGSVNERVKEIGIFRAIGFRKSHIMKIIMLETSITCALGGLIGYLSGVLVAKSTVIFIEQKGLFIQWHPLLGIIMIMGSIFIGLLASWFPATKAANLDPQEALRHL